MKLSHLKQIIKEELKRLGPLQKEDIVGDSCGGVCSITMGVRVYTGVCTKTHGTSPGPHGKTWEICECHAGPYVLDCNAETNPEMRRG